MACLFKEVSTTTAARTLTSALGLTDKLHCGEIDVRSNAGATGTTYWGHSTVTTSANRGGYIVAGESFTWLPSTGQKISTDEIYIISTDASQALFFTVIH